MTKKLKQAIEINFFYFALKETCFFVYFYVIYTFKCDINGLFIIIVVQK